MDRTKVLDKERAFADFEKLSKERKKEVADFILFPI